MSIFITTATSLLLLSSARRRKKTSNIYPLSQLTAAGQQMQPCSQSLLQSQSLKQPRNAVVNGLDHRLRQRSTQKKNTHTFKLHQKKNKSGEKKYFKVCMFLLFEASSE